MSDLYRERILEHYRNPRHEGELDDATLSIEGVNPQCGDEFEFDLRLSDDGETIDAIRFRGDGCALSTASASLVAKELIGKPTTTLLEMDGEDVTDILGVDVTPMRMKCAVLPQKTLQTGLKRHITDQE